MKPLTDENGRLAPRLDYRVVAVCDVHLSGRQCRPRGPEPYFQVAATRAPAAHHGAPEVHAADARAQGGSQSQRRRSGQVSLRHFDAQLN